MPFNQKQLKILHESYDLGRSTNEVLELLPNIKVERIREYYKARKKGFSSVYLCRKAEIEATAKKLGYSSRTAYERRNRENTSKNQGYESAKEYINSMHEKRAIRNGKTIKELRKEMEINSARRKGFASLIAYKRAIYHRNHPSDIESLRKKLDEYLNNFNNKVEKLRRKYSNDIETRLVNLFYTGYSPIEDMEFYNEVSLEHKNLLKNEIKKWIWNLTINENDKQSFYVIKQIILSAVSGIKSVVAKEVDGLIKSRVKYSDLSLGIEDGSSIDYSRLFAKNPFALISYIYMENKEIYASSARLALKFRSKYQKFENIAIELTNKSEERFKIDMQNPLEDKKPNLEVLLAS